MSRSSLQTVLLAARPPAVVVGIPAVLRTAGRLAAEEGVGPMLLCNAPEEFRGAWSRILNRLSVRTVSSAELAGALDPHSPVLVIRGDGMVWGPSLTAFLLEARRRATPSAWACSGRLVCLYQPEARGLTERWADLGWPLDAILDENSTARIEAAEGSFTPLERPEDVSAAEARLFASLGHERDGYLVDRRVSVVLSRRLVRTNITPNQITAVSLAVGIAGVALVASPGYASSLIGVLLLWLSKILDGCDGEIARLKLLSSRAGQQFDLFCDRVVNFSTIAAIVWHVRRILPGALALPLALVLLTGVALSAFTVWWLFQRKPDQRPLGLERVFQRLASRDFVYLLIPLAAVNRLEWFVYAAALGAHLFWIGLLVARARWGLAERLVETSARSSRS